MLDVQQRCSTYTQGCYGCHAGFANWAGHYKERCGQGRSSCAFRNLDRHGELHALSYIGWPFIDQLYTLKFHCAWQSVAKSLHTII